MRHVRAWLVRLWNLARRRPWRQELDAELETHLALHVEDNLRAGMGRDEARRVARLHLGSLAATTEQYRERRGFPSIAILARDVRHAARSLGRARGFTVAVVTTLALGIGANATALAALYSLVIAPRPVDEPERLVQLFNLRESRNPDNPHSESSWVQYLDFRARSSLFDEAALRTPTYQVVNRGSSSRRIKGQRTTAEFFDLIGATPVLGRFFSPEEVETGPGDVVVLSESWWEDEFDADPEVVGTRITFDNQAPYTIIGVAPRRVEAFDREARFTLPYHAAPRDRNPARGRYNAHSDDLWLRLAQGVSREAALEQISAIEREWFENTADADGRRLFGFYDARVEFDLPHPLERSLYLLEGGSLVIFLAGCLNVMILVLGRVNQKRHELSIRQAIGAGLPALRRLMLAESLLLAGAAALAGVTMAWGSIRVVNRYLAVLSPQTMPVDLDVPVLVGMLVASVGVVCVMNLLPLEWLWRAGALLRVDGSQRTSSTGRLSATLGGGLVIGQVAMAFVLLVAAGLLLNSFRQVLTVDPGFDAARVVEGRLDFATVQAFYPSRTEAAGLKRRIVDAMSTIPGVEHVGLSMFPMFSHDLRSGSVSGGTALGASAGHLIHYVSPGFFATMGIPIQEGRACNSSDSASAVVVDRLFARRSFGDRSAVGLEVETPVALGVPRDRIIGVAGRAHLRGLEQRDGAAIVYRCEPVDRGWWEYSILLRTSRPADGVVGEMQARLHEIDPRLPLSYSGSLGDALDEMLLGRKAITILLACCAGLALLLSAIGIYAVLAHRVGQRRREIGIRIALGARRQEVHRLVLADGLGKTAIGLVLGIGAAVVLTRLLERFLFDVTVSDPWTYVGAVGLFAIAAAAACVLPVRRALTIDPLESLRVE